MTLQFGSKERFIFIISILTITDLSILLNIPFLRQILGFLFLIILPGLLILRILKLNRIGSTEKFVLSVGLSISFLMFFGLLLNNSSLSLGYFTPLSTISLLVSFNLAFIVLTITGAKINNDQIFPLPNLDLSTSEKAFLIVPILFPALSILGTHLMKTCDNNIILMFLLFLIPIYVIFVCFFNHKFPTRIYPVVIFLISVSLLLIIMLRFPHIYGHDVHTEYGIFFQTTLDKLHWSVFGHSTLDACLSISLLPTIFQSILNMNAQEYFFKGVYVSICSFIPLVIYIISKKYVGELYAFLASFFFMSQTAFLSTASNPRTNVAIFFVALAVMVFFNDKIEPLKRMILFIIFMLSVVVSHYSTAYIFFFIMLGTFAGVEILSKKYTFKRVISLTLVILFFAFIFFWYSQVTETAFKSGVGFVEKTFLNLNKFFIEEMREPLFGKLVGQELVYPILSRANLAVTWCTFIFIGIGVLTMLIRYKEMVVVSNINLKKPDFLKTKFEMEYLMMALVCSGLLVVMVALPFVSVGYGIQRLYSLMMVILSVCFIIGGMTLSKNLSFIKKALPKKPILRKKSFTKRSHYLRNNGGSDSQVWAYLIILLLLTPYFLFQTDAMYQVFGAQVSVNLNSEGKAYNREYVHDSESCAAKWLKEYKEAKLRIYTDHFGAFRLVSQGPLPYKKIDERSFPMHKKLKEGYIYLYYTNVVENKMVVERVDYNMSEYSDTLIGKSKIYDNNCAEIYR